MRGKLSCSLTGNQPTVDNVLQYQIRTTGTLPTNQWHLIAYTVDAVKGSFYTNGTIAAVTTLNNTKPTTFFKDIFNDATTKSDSIVIGASRYDNATFDPFNGYISAVRIYTNIITDFSWYLENTHPTNDLETTFGQ